jgi:hypothetical protein
LGYQRRRGDIEINKLFSTQYGIKLLDKELDFGALITFINLKNKNAIIFCRAANKGGEFLKYKALFEQISASFKFQEETH